MGHDQDDVLTREAEALRREVSTRSVTDKAASSPARRARGAVRFSDGSPAAKAEVMVLTRRLRSDDQTLGKSTALDDGSYAVEYAAKSDHVDIVVRASLDGETVTSPLIVGAGVDEVVDLVLGEAFTGPSDYRRTRQAIDPILERESGPDTLGDFSEDELALLAAKSGVDPIELALVRQASALAAQTKLSPALFYAMGRQRIPPTMAGIVSTAPQARREAVATAIKTNVVPRSLEKALTEELEDLDKLAVAEALREGSPGTASTLGALLAAAGIASATRAALVALHIEHDGDTHAVWKTARDTGLLTPAQVTSVQDTLRLAALTLDHVPLVEALHGEKLRTPADLAGLEKPDWRRLVESAGVPPDLQAAKVGADEYVERIAAIVEEAVPTARLAARAERVGNGQDVRGFLERHTEFDLRATPVAAFLRGKPGALDYLPDEEARNALRRQLERIERVFRIAPPGRRFDTMEALLAGGIGSARAIVAMGRAAFERRFAKTLGVEPARRVFARATHAVATASTLIARHGTADDTIAVLPRRPSSLTRLPDYQTLFGSADAGLCADCQSVYSPAAYLTDLMSWLDGRPDEAGGRALDRVFEVTRRPDLGALELSCANTHVPLPTIDLVNELLELAVAPPEVPVAYQTRGAAPDLRVQPEHQHTPAYDVLAGVVPARDAVYPFELPYNLWLDQARTYLRQLGGSRSALMEALHPGGHSAALADPAVAAESLGMTPLEWDIIAGKPLTPPRAPAAFWGLAGDPAWVTTLSRVSTLLDRAALGRARDAAFDALLDWLRTGFVQRPGHEVGLWFEDGRRDAERAQLIGLEAEHLDRLHRFVRLQRRLGWTAADLDRAIAVLGGGVLDETLLLRLATMQRLRSVLDGASVADVLSWWGPIDTRRWQSRLRTGRPAGVPADQVGTGLVFHRALAPVPTDEDEPSPYDALFLASGAARDAAFRIGPDGSALLDETGSLGQHLPAIAAALHITADELSPLLAGLPDDRLSLANLSRLHREVLIAGTLRSPPGDLRSLRALSDADPFVPANITSAITFVEDVRAVSGSNVSADELSYLLHHVGTASAPSPMSVGVLLLELRDALRHARAEHTGPAWRPVARTIVIEKLSGTLGLEPAITAPLLERHVRSPLPGDVPALDVFLDPALLAYDGIDASSGAPVPPGPGDLAQAFATYERLHKIALVVRRLRLGAADLRWAFEIGPSTGTLDLASLPAAAGGPHTSLAAWRRLQDAVALRDRLPGGSLFGVFEQAAEVHASGDAIEIAAAHEALLDELARVTRWTRADVEVLAGVPVRGSEAARPSALGLAFPADWRDERALARLEAAMFVVARVGLDARTLVSWRSVPAGLDAQRAQADEITDALRARHDDAQGRAIATSLNDEIRQRQRDALVAWLLAHDGRFRDTTDLHAHFLLDVEISPCQLTSRVRQATSSVQLFVQRALMNLEPGVTLSVDDAREWTWRKTYRVWEANRKVFLYPENWIEPELRDDKTPLFRQLEDELAQQEATEEAAERAFIAYLERLDELARLEVVALLHDDDGDSETLHVLARTRNAPPMYFYRQRERGVRWTPWERVDVDIDGDHVVLAIHRRRLFVLWTPITEAAVEEVVNTPAALGNTTAARPQRYFQLRLAWTERRDGRWLGRKLSSAQVGATDADFDRQRVALAKSAGASARSFFLRVREDAAGDLLVEPIRRPPHGDRNPAYFQTDRFRMSGCDGTVSVEAAARESLIVRLPENALPSGQRFASRSPGSALALPARNPSTGAHEMVRVLDRMDGDVEIVPTAMLDFHSQDVFFVQDRRRTFHVTPRVTPRWVRQPPGWLEPDRVSLELARLYPELDRPLVPRPDAWLLDSASRVRPSSSIRIAPTPALNGSAPAGLPGAGAATLAEELGARVAYLGLRR